MLANLWSVDTKLTVSAYSLIIIISSLIGNYAWLDCLAPLTLLAGFDVSMLFVQTLFLFAHLEI